MAHLLRTAHDAGELRLPDPADPARGGGFTVLGMGKLGARELNYSSDVDLVLLYDPAAPIYTERARGHAMGGFTSRIARSLVTLMEARDADGYVFRTDLRLRPDPSVTPPAVALPAAITYYESMGQNWERAAMIKARPVAGDLAWACAFLEAIRPFVWRRGLDFAAVADIHAMKRRIDEHKGGALADAPDPLARIAGHNVKLGEGGIREIEFLAQTLQLVWGGRDPALRVPTTLGALRLLVRAGHVPRNAARELAAAYRFLRRVEHRLQMIADRQTHELPQRPAELARFATFMGYTDATEFATRPAAPPAPGAGALRRGVRAGAGAAGTPAKPALELDFSGVDAAPGSHRPPPLRALGFGNPDRIVAAVRGWQAGHVRALRSARARELLAQLLPRVLAALARQPQPDTVFNRFDAFLARQPAGVQLLSLFQRNPGLIDRIAAVLGAAPSLADHLASHPAAFDGLLSPEEDPDPARLAARPTAGCEAARGCHRDHPPHRARGGFHRLGRHDGRPDGRRRRRPAPHRDRRRRAECVAAAGAGGLCLPLRPRAGRRHGGGGDGQGRRSRDDGRLRPRPDAGLRPPEGVSDSRGARRLPVSQWFVRAAHAYVAAVTAPGVDGPLYEVDMRLRPSGNKGPVAVSLGSFRRYHAESAWTWERMALTRARVVAGPPALRARIEAAIAEALAAAGDARTHPRRRRRDARTHAARPAAGRPVGCEAARRGARSRWSSSPRCCSSSTRARRRSCVRPPRASR